MAAFCWSSATVDALAIEAADRRQGWLHRDAQGFSLRPGDLAGLDLRRDRREHLAARPASRLGPSIRRPSRTAIGLASIAGGRAGVDHVRVDPRHAFESAYFSVASRNANGRLRATGGGSARRRAGSRGRPPRARAPRAGRASGPRPRASSRRSPPAAARRVGVARQLRDHAPDRRIDGPHVPRRPDAPGPDRRVGVGQQRPDVGSRSSGPAPIRAQRACIRGLARGLGRRGRSGRELLLASPRCRARRGGAGRCRGSRRSGCPAARSAASSVSFARSKLGAPRRVLVADAVEPALEPVDAGGVAVGVLIAVVAVVPVEDVEAAVGAGLLRRPA